MQSDAEHCRYLLLVAMTEQEVNVHRLGLQLKQVQKAAIEILTG